MKKFPLFRRGKMWYYVQNRRWVEKDDHNTCDSLPIYRIIVSHRRTTHYAVGAVP